MKRSSIVTFLVVLLLCVSSCDKGESFALESDTPFKYNRKNEEFVVKVPAEGGEYVFTDPKHSIWFDLIYRDAEVYRSKDYKYLHNEYITANVDEDNVLTVTISPNNTGDDVRYKIHICGIKTYAELIFKQSKAK